MLDADCSRLHELLATEALGEIGNPERRSGDMPVQVSGRHLGRVENQRIPRLSGMKPRQRTMMESCTFKHRGKRFGPMGCASGVNPAILVILWRAVLSGPDRGQCDRSLDRNAARLLASGDAHYMAYVGPPDQYDLMGATQFRLLTTLGLRAFHSVLDFGCGSLRLGKLLIPYLDPGRYFGLEPNNWLIEDAIQNEIGEDLIRLKQPRFFNHNDFDASKCGSSFDFIVAQSIFSHAGIDVIEIAVKSMARCLNEIKSSPISF